MSRLRSQLLPILLARLRDAGIDPQSLVEGLELGSEPESQTELWISLEAFHELCDKLAERLGDPYVGLHTAIALPRGSYGLVEFIFRSAPTPREALQRLVRYVPLINNLLRFTVVVDNGKATVQAKIRGEPLCLGRQANELSMAIFFKVGLDIAGTAWRPDRVWFAHPAPPDTSELARFFGTDALAFDTGGIGMRFDEELLDRPIPTADHALYSFLDRQAQEQVAKLGHADNLEPLREKIRLSLQHGEPNIDEVAKMLGTSARSLQRRLADQNTSFRALTDDVRHALARTFLEDHRRPLTEVAFLLGYSDLRAFVRAHKRWSGKTPGAVRRGEG